jgi:hypothetical protein
MPLGRRSCAPDGLQIMGNPRGDLPSGKAASIAAISESLNCNAPAPAFSLTCDRSDALGMTNTSRWRKRKLKATWRGVPECAAAIVCSTAADFEGPAKIFGDWPKGV